MHGGVRPLLFRGCPMRNGCLIALCAALIGSTASGQSIEQANWGGRRAAVQVPYCPPGTPTTPGMPPTGQPGDQPPAITTIPQDMADVGGRGAALAQGSGAMPPAFFGDLVGISATRFLSTNPNNLR